MPKWPSKPRASVCEQDETRRSPSSFNYFCTLQVPFWRVAVTFGPKSWLACSFLASQAVGGCLPTSPPPPPAPSSQTPFKFWPPWVCPKKLATNNTRARPDNTSNLRLARSEGQAYWTFCNSRQGKAITHTILLCFHLKSQFEGAFI